MKFADMLNQARQETRHFRVLPREVRRAELSARTFNNMIRRLKRDLQDECDRANNSRDLYVIREAIRKGDAIRTRLVDLGVLPEFSR